MPFPVTPRYFLNFRNSDTGLTPSFVYFKNASSFAVITPPSIIESPAGGGTYYFDWTWTTKSDADITFEVDGGASIPTEEVRYIKGSLSPRDRYLDEPVSQVVNDVWDDNTNRATGTKGDFVEHVGIDSDAVNAATLFGQVYKARDVVMGGTGFGGTGVDVKTVSDKVGTAADASSVSTVFGKTLLYKESVRGDTAGASDGNNVKQVYDRVGAPVGATISADIAAVQTTENTINTKIGTPTGASVSADIAAVQTKLGTPAGASVSADIATINSGVSTVGTNVSAIKAKTDNLPSDPASQGTTNTSITSAVSSIKGAGPTDITQVKTVVDAIKAKTDNLPPDPADASDIAASISSTVSSIKGADNRDLTQIAGTGIFVAGTDNLHAIAANAATASGAPSAATVASAVWNEALAGHALGGSTGKKLSDAALTTDVTTSETNITTGLGPKLDRALGLMHENSVLDQTIYDGSNNLTSGRLRTYDSKTNAQAAGVTGLVATYTITATYVGENVQTYTVVREP